MTQQTITAEAFRGLLVSRMSERVFKDHVVREAKCHGWMVYWTWRSDHSPAGFPDLCLLRERVVFAELKTESGKLTDDQRRWIAHLAKAGQEVHIWRPSLWDALCEVLK